MTPEEIEKIISAQTKMLDRMWANIDMEKLQGKMAQIYSEEYTADRLQAIMPQMIDVMQQMQAEKKAQKAAAKASGSAPPANAPPK